MTNTIEALLTELNYPSQLLEAANDMIVRGRYEISVVTAQMACEICTERVFRAFFAIKNVAFLEDSVDDLLPSYNLANDKVRKVYFALSNDPINQQFFWSEYKVVVSLRNKAIHAGARIQESQAQMVLRVAKLVVRHLQSIERSALKQAVSIAENITNTNSS